MFDNYALVVSAVALRKNVSDLKLETLNSLPTPCTSVQVMKQTNSITTTSTITVGPKAPSNTGPFILLPIFVNYLSLSAKCEQDPTGGKQVHSKSYRGSQTPAGASACQGYCLGHEAEKQYYNYINYYSWTSKSGKYTCLTKMPQWSVLQYRK